MNKIFLEELYAQAKLSTKEGRMNAPVGVVAEKFAELIVKECIAQCEKLANDYWADVENPTSQDAADEIKQHFGVEE